MSSSNTLQKLALQEAEYYLPYHWLQRKGAKEVQMSKLNLIAAHANGLNLTGGSALDLGCGDGKHTYEMQQRLSGKFEFKGIDFSERAIIYAKMLAPNIEFAVQNGNQTAFANQSFQLVVSIEVIEHIPIDDVPGFLNEINRILKPGGGVVLTTPTTNRPLDDKHFQHFTQQKMHKYLQDAGFEVVKTSGFGITLPRLMEKSFRYLLEVPTAWRLQKHVHGKVLDVQKANCIVVSAIKR